MSKNVFLLFIGIILFVLGGYQNIQYEEHSIIVAATITDIETVDNTDDGPVSYKHTYYGEYTVNGKKYTNKVLDTKYNGSPAPNMLRGDTIDIRVYPDNAGIKVPEGGFFIVSGIVLIVYSLVASRKIKKQED